MNFKNIYIISNNLRTYIFPNILVLYTYLHIIFLFIYFYIDKNSLNLSRIEILAINFCVTFMSILISFFMIFFCLIMTILEFILRKHLKFKIIQLEKIPSFWNQIHYLLFYFGLIIISTYISFILYKIFFT